MQNADIFNHEIKIFFISLTNAFIKGQDNQDYQYEKKCIYSQMSVIWMYS